MLKKTKYARPYFKRHTRVNKLAYSRSYAVVAAAASVVALKEARTVDDRPVAATFRPLFTQISTLEKSTTSLRTSQPLIQLVLGGK